MGQKISGLEDLLDALEGAAEGDAVALEDVHRAAGRRSFGPVLLVPGLLAASPLSGIPGTPTVVGIMTFLISGQLLIGRESFWLPDFLLRRSVSRGRFETALEKARPVARFADKLMKPRLEWLADGPAVYVVAVLTLLLALMGPALEALPFAITGVGAALTAFGLALVADDGLLALIALVFCVATGIAIFMGFS